MGIKFNPITGQFDLTGSARPAGSDTEIQFNDNGAFGADSGFVYDKTTKSLGVQTTYGVHPAHFNAAVGATINNIATASASLIAETLPTSPTGSIDLIAEFTSGSGGSTSQNTSGSGYSASSQSIDYNIYAAIEANGTYYRSQYFESLNFTDTLGDSSGFSVFINGLTPLTNQTHWYIEKQINGGGFNDSVIVAASNNYEDSNFSGTVSYAGWPTFYQLSYTAPVAGSVDTIQQTNVGFGTFTADGKTYDVEMKAAVNIGGVYFTDSNIFSSSWADPNDASTFDLEVFFTHGTGDDNVARISFDGGSTWSYHFVSTGGSFTWNNPGSDSIAQTAWSNDVSNAEIEYSFKCYGKGLNQGNNATIYAASADTYTATITTPNTPYILKHNFSGFPAGGAKILADYTSGVAYGKNVTDNYYDVGYTTWPDGTSISPNTYGLTGSSQNTQIRLVGFDSSLQIYSPTPLVISTTATTGTRYISGSFTYPSGVTRVKVSININGAGYTVHKIFTSPTNTFTYDTLDTSWNASSTISPTAAVPSTGRFDLSRTTANQTSDNILAIDTTNSGTRYPSLAFGVAASTTSSHTVQTRIATNTSTAHLLYGASRHIGYTSGALSIVSWTLGDTYSFNLQKSSSTHTTIWGADATHPMMYAYSAGDSNRGTVYFGQSSVSYGGSSKVVIAPSAGGTTALLLRRTSGFTGDNITIDEAGSYRCSFVVIFIRPLFDSNLANHERS